MRVSFDICDFVLYRGGGGETEGGCGGIGQSGDGGQTDSPSPLDSIRDAVLTVSPNRQYLGIFRPTTPAHTGPARGKVSTLLPSQRRRRSHAEPLCSVSRMGNSQPATHCSRSWKLQTARDKKCLAPCLCLLAANSFSLVQFGFRLVGSYKSQPLARQLGAVQAHQHSKKNTSRDDEGPKRSLLLLFFFLAP